MDLGLTFDDVAIVPQYNNVPSRTEPSLASWLTKELKIGIPIVNAPMDTVISLELAHVLSENGTFPIFHRFYKDIKELDIVLQKFKRDCIVTCGVRSYDAAVGKGDLEQSFRLLDTYEHVVGVCIDVAHGHSVPMHKAIEKIKIKFPHKQIIAGNVCSPMAYQDLVNAGADCVKTGVGPGACCTTRIVTGFGVPQFTAIQSCAEVAKKLRVPIIADGGIRNSSDVVKALAAGASCVMLGKLFALTHESSAPKRKAEGEHCYAKYRGQASEDFQNEFYGGLKDKTVAEGTDFWAPVKCSAQELIDGLLGGIRSGMTYGGARSIKELQRKAEFIRVTPNYISESYPRVG